LASGRLPQKGIQALKTSASKLLGMVLNVSGQGTAKEPCGYKVMACPVSMLKIRMTLEMGGNCLTQVYLEKCH